MSGLDKLTRGELIALALKQHETVELQAKRISELEDEIARPKVGKSGALRIKASVKKTKRKAARKKRMQSFARSNRMPTEVIRHAVDECPNCCRKLEGGTVKWKHQVIEAPVAPAKITERLFIERRRGLCGKRCISDAKEALKELVVGKKTIGIGLMSLIAYLKIACRVAERARLKSLKPTAF